MAVWAAKRCFLNCEKLVLRPSIRPPSCTASKCSAQRTVSQSRKHHLAVKCGSGRAAGIRTSLPNVLSELLETSLRPSIRPPSSTAGEAPCQRTVSQSQNTMAVKYGSGPRPAAHTAKRCFGSAQTVQKRTLAVQCRKAGPNGRSEPSFCQKQRLAVWAAGCGPDP